MARPWLPLLLVALAVMLTSCTSSLITVPITIRISAGSMVAPGGPAPVGRLQGYVFTPDPDSADAVVGTSPRVLQTPIPPAGFRVPVASVLVSPQGSSSGATRPDPNGFFLFSGQPVSAPPAPVRVEFPGGGFENFVTDVPIVAVDMEGWAVLQIDLQEIAEYQNNARDIEGMQSAVLNASITAIESARIRLFVSDRGDLQKGDLETSADAHLLLEQIYVAGHSTTLADVEPLNEDKLLALADPSSGNEMLWLYLLTEEPQNPASGANAAVNNLTIVLRALVGAPL